jgi:2-hydroxychromene-2-carboxylate isomerase
VPDGVAFYFDFSCPYAYLASLQLDDLALRSGRQVVLRPFLLGGVFAAIGQAQNLSATLSPAKARHNRADLLRQAAWIGAELRTPIRHPNRTVDALRELLACPEAARRDVMAAFYAAYWRDQRDLADAATRAEALAALGLDASDIQARAQGDTIRAELRARTDDALAAGVFGAPAFVVDGALFWGADRVDMVVAAARDGFEPVGGAAAFSFA